MVRVERRFQGKDGSLPVMREEGLEFRKSGVMKRPWVPERRKSSRKQALGNPHWSPLEAWLNRKQCVSKKRPQVLTKSQGD